MANNGRIWHSGQNDETPGPPLESSESSCHGYGHPLNQQDLPWHEFDKPWNPEIHPWTEEVHHDLNPGWDPIVVLPSPSRHSFGLPSDDRIGFPETLHHSSKNGFARPSAHYHPEFQQPHFPPHTTHSHHLLSENLSTPLENDSQFSNTYQFYDQPHFRQPVPPHFFASSRSLQRSSIPLPPNASPHNPLDPSRSAFLLPGPPSSHSSSMPVACPSNPFHPQKRPSSISHAQSRFAGSVDLATNASELVPDNSRHHAEQLVREARVWKLAVKHQNVLDRLEENMKPEEKKQYKKDREGSNAAEKREVAGYRKWLRAHNLTGSARFQSYVGMTASGKRMSNQIARRLRDLRLEQQNATEPTPTSPSSAKPLASSHDKVSPLERKVWKAIQEHTKVLFRYEGRQEMGNLGPEERRKYKREVDRLAEAERAARRKYGYWLEQTHTAPSSEYKEYLRLSRTPGSRAYRDWRRVQSTLAQ